MPNFPIANNEDVKAISNKIGESTDAANASGTTGFSLLKFLTATWTAAKAAFLDVAISSRAASADLGTRGDAAATAVNTTNTAVAYLKGIFNAVAGSSSVAGTSNRRVFFNAAGPLTGSFTIPAGVTKILLSACGAGGASLAGATADTAAQSGTSTVLTGAVALTLPGGAGAIYGTIYNGTKGHMGGLPGGAGGGKGGGVNQNAIDNTMLDYSAGAGITSLGGSRGGGGTGSSPGLGGGGSLGGGGAGSAGSGSSGCSVGIGGPSLIMDGGTGCYTQNGGDGGPGGGGGSAGNGGGGGGAAAIFQKEYTVTPGSVLNYTLGVGGKNSAALTTPGGNGGNGMLIVEW